MNKLIYNYKLHVEEVVDGRTFAGVIDLGWRQYMHRHLQLAGMDFPDRRILDATERKKHLKTWSRAKPALELLLLYPSYEPVQSHGRTIVIAPHVPNRHGRALVNAYVPVQNESFDYPHLTRKVAGFVLLNAVRFMHHLGERGFDLEEGTAIINLLNPYDFTK